MLTLVKLTAFLQGNPLPDPSTLSPLAAAQLAPPSDRFALSIHPCRYDMLTLLAHRSTGPKLTCEACTTDITRPLLVEEHQWYAHRRTRAHQRMQRIRDGTQRAKGPPKKK